MVDATSQTEWTSSPKSFPLPLAGLRLTPSVKANLNNVIQFFVLQLQFAFLLPKTFKK